MTPLIECSSAIVKAYGYDMATNTLSIRFPDGAVYLYSNVPQDTYDEFCAAESKGKAFASLIRGKFGHVPVLPEAKAATPATSEGAPC